MPGLGVVSTRLALALSLAFATAGCTDPQSNFFPQDSQFTDANCHAIANDRANDAGIIVEDMDVQRQVFQATYADCIDWHRTH